MSLSPSNARDLQITAAALMIAAPDGRLPHRVLMDVARRGGYIGVIPSTREAKGLAGRRIDQALRDLRELGLAYRREEMWVADDLVDLADWLADEVAARAGVVSDGDDEDGPSVEAMAVAV